SSPVRSSAAASRETETTAPSRYVLPKDLEAAIKHLDDQQLDRLVSVALEERARWKKPPVPEKNQRKAENVSPRLPQGKLNAVLAAFRQVLRHRGLPENSDFHDPMFKEHWLVTARSSAYAVGSRGRVCLHARLLIDEFSKCSDGAKNL